ncbi:hypothetical protein SAMN05192544_10366 [Paraburkholderia hospita]|nr:hypothetical protein SAMN05192544_10366 [Paraburkholderia hospita]
MCQYSSAHPSRAPSCCQSSYARARILSSTVIAFIAVPLLVTLSHGYRETPTSRNSSMSRSGSTGLTRCCLKPASVERATSASLPKPDRAINTEPRVCGDALSSWATSYPVIPGRPIVQYHHIGRPCGRRLQSAGTTLSRPDLVFMYAQDDGERVSVVPVVVDDQYSQRLADAVCYDSGGPRRIGYGRRDNRQSHGKPAAFALACTRRRNLPAMQFDHGSMRFPPWPKTLENRRPGRRMGAHLSGHRVGMAINIS